MGRRRIPVQIARQRGIALVLVLWVLLLVTISTGAYTLTARMDQLEAHTILSGTQARLAAEAGINLAVLSLRDPDENTRLVPDGRPYSVNYEGMLVEVRVTHERGKLDINQATDESFINLFVGNGMDPGNAEYLAAAIADWKDSDEVERGATSAAEETTATTDATAAERIQFRFKMPRLTLVTWPLILTVWSARPSRPAKSSPMVVPPSTGSTEMASRARTGLPELIGAPCGAPCAPPIMPEVAGASPTWSTNRTRPKVRPRSVLAKSRISRPPRKEISSPTLASRLRTAIQ